MNRLIANSPTFQLGYVQGWRWGVICGICVGGSGAIIFLAGMLWLGRGTP